MFSKHIKEQFSDHREDLSNRLETYSFRWSRGGNRGRSRRVQNGAESIGNRWWVQDGGWERKPDQVGEHSLYTGGGGATEAQVRGKELIRQVKGAEQSHCLEAENTTKIYNET